LLLSILLFAADKEYSPVKKKKKREMKMKCTPRIARVMIGEALEVPFPDWLFYVISN